MATVIGAARASVRDRAKTGPALTRSIKVGLGLIIVGAGVTSIRKEATTAIDSGWTRFSSGIYLHYFRNYISWTLLLADRRLAAPTSSAPFRFSVGS